MKPETIAKVRECDMGAAARLPDGDKRRLVDLLQELQAGLSDHHDALRLLYPEMGNEHQRGLWGQADATLALVQRLVVNRKDEILYGRA